MAALAGARLKLAQQARAHVVVGDHRQHHRQLGVHPAIARAPANAVAQPQPQPQTQRRHRQQGGKAQQLARHEQQALLL